MSFVEQQDVFDAVEPVIRGVFEEFSDKAIDQEFVHIPFAESMLKYGNDKPDLRIPIEISDVTNIFRGSGFSIFAKAIEGGSVVRAVPGPKCGSRAIADRMNSWAQSEGAPGMGYIIYGDGEARAPLPRRLVPKRLRKSASRPVSVTVMPYFLPVPMKQLRHRLPAVRGYGLARSRA